MIAAPPDLTPLVLEGHVIDRLRELPEESVQAVVTSPPYWGLRTYGTAPQVWGGDPAHSHAWESTPPRRRRDADDAGGDIQKGSNGASYEAQGGDRCSCGAWRGEVGLEPTPDLFVSHVADVFDEVRRVLRSDGTLWLNVGDTYSTHPVGLTGDARWRASSIQGFRHRVGAEQAGQFDKRVEGLKPKDLAGIPWMLAFELRRRGWWLRADVIWSKPNPMPESVTDRPARSHEYVFLLTKRGRYFYDADRVRQPLAETSVPRYQRAVDHEEYFDPARHKHGDGIQVPMKILARAAAGVAARGTANLKSVWPIPVEPRPEAHFATFPEALVERCLQAGTSERGCCASCGTPWAREVRAEGGTIGSDWIPDKNLEHGKVERTYDAREKDGTYRRVDLGFFPGCDCTPDQNPPPPPTVPCLVLDPFAGSGTTLAVARRMGLRSVGIELNPEYVALARRRASADVRDILTA
jgi:DNA modification methylase